MKHIDTITSIAVTLMVVLSVVTLGVVGFTGAAVAQSVSVELQDSITSDMDQFEVTVQDIGNTNAGCLEVTNSNTDSRYINTDLSAGSSYDVSEEDVGRIESGDVIEAKLYDNYECFNAGDTDSTTVQEGANFDVTIDGTNSPVSEGDTLTVTTTIENTGDEGGSQTVDLLIGDFPEDDTSVTLGAGESVQRTLTWETEQGDAGTYGATVLSENDSESRDVVVEDTEPANFEVEIDSTNAPLVQGERLDVQATIENTGEATESQEIDLWIDGEFNDTEAVTLDSGESETVTLRWNTGLDDEGEYEAEVRSDDTADSVNISVVRQPTFNITINSTTSPVRQGQTLGFTTTVQNTGEVTDTQQIDLIIGDQVIDSAERTLEPGASIIVTFDWETEFGDVGDYIAEIVSATDASSTDVTVLEEGQFDVTIIDTNSPVPEGGTIDVTARVNNTGGAEETQSVGLQIGDRTIASTELTLEGGQSEVVTLSWPTGTSDAGDYTATVGSDDDADSIDIRVDAGAEYVVELSSSNSPVVEGEPMEFTVIVQNAGDVPATQPVDLRIGDQTVDTVDLTLDGGESDSVTFEWQTVSGDAGDYTATVASGDSSGSLDVSVLADAEFAVNITSTNSPVEDGETLEVTATVQNVGDVSGTQRVTLTAGGAERDSRELTLEPGESREITVSWEGAGGEDGEYDVEVASQSDSDMSLAAVAQSDSSISTGIWLLLLLLLLLLAAVYYYIRRRQMAKQKRNAGDSPGTGPTAGEDSGPDQPGEAGGSDGIDDSTGVDESPGGNE